MFQLLSYNVWVQILCKWKHDKQIPWSWDIPSVETFVLHLGERAFQPKSPVKTSLLIEEHLQLALCLTQPMSGTLVGGLIQEEDWLLLKIPLEIQKKPPPLLPQLSRPPPRRPPARQCAGVTDLGRDYLRKSECSLGTSSKEAEEDEVEAFLLPSDRLIQDLAKVCCKIGSRIDEGNV